jgi:DNA-binding beta-propeller fold protein YncE
MRRPLANVYGRFRSERLARRLSSWASHRPVIAVLLACALILALGAVQAQAAPKGVVDFFGSSGTGAGQFNTPRGVAVNQASGDIYIVDSANNRIQRFDAMRNFVSAWGIDVISPGAPGDVVPGNERQTVTVVADGGTFTLTFIGQTTGDIAFDATAAAVQAALEGLSTLAAGDVTVTGGAGEWTVEFTGRRANTDVAQMTGDPANLTGDPKSVTVETPVEGVSAFETCTIVMSCQQGSAGLATDAPAGELSSPQGIAIDQSTGNVYVTNQGNRRVEKFTSSGTFMAAFGWNVDPDEDPALGLETCTSMTGCQIGVSGTGASQFGTVMGHLAVDPSNQQVVVADPSNRRVKKFDSNGNFVLAFGASGTGVGQFGSNQPTRVAVDSSGSIYTVESSGTNTRRVQKFSPSGATAAIFAPEHVSGTSNDLAPTDVAVNPANDNVLVTKPTGPTGSIERRVLEFNLAGALVDTHAAGAALPVANGLAVRGSTGRLYLPTSTNQRVWVLGPITPPVVTIDPVTIFTADTATFSGTVNPNGTVARTFYRFEYSDDDGGTWARVPSADVVVGTQTTPQPVSQEVTTLEPNTQYRVRLVASREFAAGSATPMERTFRTPAAPPSISGVAAREITDTTTVLAGHVDPNRLHTTYRFEYGTDASYGSTTAVDNAGSGPRKVPVSKPITGLAPNTTYHFRLVATNAAGETQGTDQMFTTATGPPPPSGRAYEMVSPLDKNGGDIDRDLLENLHNQSGAAPSGDAVAYTSRVQFGDIESGTLFPNYVARRGAAGWTTEGISPPIGNVNPTGIESPRVMGLSLDLSKAFVIAAPPLTADAEKLNGSRGLYMRSSGSAERYTLLSSPWTTLSEDSGSSAPKRFEFAADTPDSRHVVFNSGRRLLDPLTSGAPPDAGDPNAVYEWVDGSVRLASVPPPGVSFDTGGGSVFAGARMTVLGLPGDHLISDDGRRLFFTAELQGGNAQLFVREDGTSTRDVSRSVLPGNPYVVNAQPEFWAAKGTDGSVAFFSANGPLTPDAAPASLYRWDANASGSQPRLKVLSHDQPPSGQPASPRVQGPAAVSDDAESVYFVAQGTLAPGATRDKPNLYLWRQDQVRYIKTLDASADQAMWESLYTNGGRAARVSADGERLLFASYAEHPGFDSTEATPEACGRRTEGGQLCRQIYLYDARSGKLSCLTCIPGVPVTGDANLFGKRPPGAQGSGPFSRQPRNLSADGRRAFFETASPLVSGDKDSTVDVYQWEDRDLDGQGELTLISSGAGANDSKFVDASASGDDVFFTTRDRLVGMDTDNQVDLYDARVGGGIPAQNPPPAPPPCQGDECQGALSGAPLLPAVGSGARSNGNLRPRPRPSFSVARLSREQRARLALGQRVVVRVRVNRAGRVSLTARAKIGRRMRAVARASKTARKAGGVGLGVKLSRKALRELSGKGRLNVRLGVRFAGVREARTSMVRLRRDRSTGEGRAR